MADLDGTDDYFDSRDVIERIEELEAEREEWVISDRDEHDALIGFRDEYAQLFVDWPYGVTFVKDSEMADYAKEWAEDIDGVQTGNWPYNHIDWAAAAESLKQDFIKVEFRGETYWGRN